MSRRSKSRAPLNRTLNIKPQEKKNLRKSFLTLDHPADIGDISGRLICGDISTLADFFPSCFVDLLFIDPPYNIDKRFNLSSFKSMNQEEYEKWIDSWLVKLIRLLKPEASIYICCDWKSSTAVFNTAKKYFIPQNRITWEREKGRGAKSNWKNCSEDIWFFTVSKKYTFNIDAVKVKRKVLAPYRDSNRQPKDWQAEVNGIKGNYRITHPSNLWTDITVPFWSMPENTDHPTQKPEKLLAKLILASSKPGDFIFDPFCGSGSALVAAKKLGRNFSGVEIDDLYCCLTTKRLQLAENNKSIQGYSDGIFWERNTFLAAKALSRKKKI